MNSIARFWSSFILNFLTIGANVFINLIYELFILRAVQNMPNMVINRLSLRVFEVIPVKIYEVAESGNIYHK